MTTAAMDSEKISLAKAILAIDNPELLVKVKSQLRHILGLDKGGEAVTDGCLPSIDASEIAYSLSRAEQDVMAGNVMAAEDVHDYYEKKYPWLCE